MNFNYGTAWRKYLNGMRDILLWEGNKMQLLNLNFLMKIGLLNTTDSSPKSNFYNETTGMSMIKLTF